MKLDRFEETLEQYIDAVGLTATQATKIENALQAVLSLALANFPDAEIYAQGSYSTDTMAKPLTAKQGGGKAGEFDIDIAIESDAWTDALQALEDTADAVEGDETFGKLSVDKTKNSCVRIQYPEDQTGVAFHIDLVPTKKEDDQRYVPDRDAEDWKESDAKKFTDWFNGEAGNNPGLRQVSVILKRLRDLAGLTDDIKSILVLTLVCLKYEDTGSIMGDLVTALEGITDMLGTGARSPKISNPVTPDEDLGEKIEDFSAVKGFFGDTRDRLVNAIAEDDANELKQLFGPGFTYTAGTQENSAKPATEITSPARAYGLVDSDCD